MWKSVRKSARNSFLDNLSLSADISAAANLSNSHHFPGRQVNVSLLDLLEVGDQLGEGVPVDHQALHLPLRVSCVCDDVGCPHLKIKIVRSIHAITNATFQDKEIDLCVCLK